MLVTAFFMVVSSVRLAGWLFWKTASDPSLWVSDWHLISGLFL